MKVVIAGPRQVGKSTLFNALTRQPDDSAARYSADNRIAVVEVPDPRIDALIEMFQPRKQARAAIQIVDAGAPPAGAARFGGQFLQELRQADAVVAVLRAFTDPSVPEPEGGVDPLRDLSELETELIIADLDLVEKRLERIEKEERSRPRGAKGGSEKETLQRMKSHLEEDRSLASMQLSDSDEEAIHHLDFVSRKPVIAVSNINEEGIGQASAADAELSARAEQAGIPFMQICARVEAEIAQLPPEEESTFLEAMGLEELGSDRLIRTVYNLLGLSSFFTVGEDEVKAWTIRKGDDAVTAAGKIHSDLARGFIRAEVVHCDDLLAAGSASAARQQGLYRLEGKSYPVRDGDTLNIRFSV